MWYALASYRDGTAVLPAIVLNGQLYDLASGWRALNPEKAAIPSSLASVAALLAGSAEELDQLAHSIAGAVTAGLLQPLEGGLEALLAPFVPPRIFGTASNYIEHAAEMNTVLAAKADSSPYIFLKASSSVIGPGATIQLPPETEKPDWEVELGVVIGKGGRRISVEDAPSHIAACTIVNDISARDMNRRSDYPFSHDWFRGKSWDTFCPLGPWLVPVSCLPDIHKLPLTLTLNGEIMQDGNTSELIWNIFEQIAYISSIVTLQTGDLIMTGTPAGVGMGKGLFLKPGDVLEAGIEGIGALRNPVAAEDVMIQGAPA